MDPRDRDRVREALRGQLVASQRAANGAVLAATGVQTAGVLDDLHPGATRAKLGPVFHDGRPTPPCGRRRPSPCTSISTARP